MLRHVVLLHPQAPGRYVTNALPAGPVVIYLWRDVLYSRSQLQTQQHPVTMLDRAPSIALRKDTSLRYKT